MYEVMAFWETGGAGVDQPPFIRDYAAIWRAADKVVSSRSLDTVSSDEPGSSGTSIPKRFGT